MATRCGLCDRTFGTKQALQQHLRDSPAHTAALQCVECDRVFNTKPALEQHLRDAPAHATTFDCDECNRTFQTEEALQQHLRDAPAHAATFDCDECDHTFQTEQALQQHLHDALAHSTSSDAGIIGDSFDLRPSLHPDVLRLLRPHGLTFGFHATENLNHVLREKDTTIMGKFTCTNKSCLTERWTSGHIAITIRLYPSLEYNARVYYQRCKRCNSLSRPELDDSYAERVSYRLATWSGIALEVPPYSGHSRRPHESRLCEGCRHGRCLQSRL